MTQKRLLSSKPAEAKTSFWTFASSASPRVGAVSSVTSSASSNPTATNMKERRIDNLLSDVSELGIQVIAEPITQQIQGKHGQHDGQPGKHRDPPRRDDQLTPIRDHETPG